MAWVNDMSSRLTARTFRRRVLRPTEGVFLFHPRAMERLIRRHLSEGVAGLAVSPLGYYLMPRTAFLAGLEEENPDALAVIEGLNLPDWVILLPMPAAQELAAGEPTRWLRDYWGRRFEAEVARAWQAARSDNQDHDAFGARGLARQIGERGLREARALLEQDRRVALDQDDETLGQHFIGFVMYLRYFVPGARAYFFPTVRDWAGLDRWLKDGGLDLPPPRHGSRRPQLLVRSRPSGFNGAPDYEPELPLRLPVGRHDPDLADGVNTILPLALKSAPIFRRKTAAPLTPASVTKSDPHAQLIEARGQDALRQAFVLARKPGRLAALWRSLSERLTPAAGLLVEQLESKAGARGCVAPPAWILTARLRLFRQGVQTAFRAEMAGRYGAALRALGLARRQYWRMMAPSSLTGQDWDGGDAVTRTLEQHQHDIIEALAHTLAATWKVNARSTRLLEQLLQRVLDESATARFPDLYSRLLRDLEQIALEGRTEYYRLQPIRWLGSGGRQPVQLGLPFQGPLKALRALNAAKIHLDQLPWSGAEVAHFTAPLQTLGDQIGQRLRQQLLPRLRNLLDKAGFRPADPRQQVARNVLQEELFDTILRRWHLRFTDLRDAVARHELRLPDPGWRELLLGDRLARFDRPASAALPGVYQPGEFYLKGLQQLIAPLFGTVAGRAITRLLLFPLGVAFIGLEALSYGLSLTPLAAGSVRLVNPGSVLGVGAGLAVMLYTAPGRKAAAALGRSCRWLFAELLNRRLARWLHWGRAVRWLRYPLVRRTSRYLLEPLLIGLALALPLIGIAGSLGFSLAGLPTFLIALGFILGSLLRNSQAGRRLLDAAITGFATFWQRVHHALLTGLFHWVVDFFGWLMHAIEQALHRVDEAVSHHRGEGRSVLAAKALIGPGWRAFSDLIHFYVAVLVEPQINPIKHFPVVTVADKLMLPFFPALTTALLALLEPVLPRFLSVPLATVTVLLSPGLFGFLAWELNENWKLYRANHPDRAQPARFGPEGETLYTLLRPGFHSGALPKAFTELRAVIRLENEHQRSYSQQLRQAETQLSRILESLQAFVTRELGFALAERWRAAGYERAEAAVVRLEAATMSLDLGMALYPLGRAGTAEEPILLDLRFDLGTDGLRGEFSLRGPGESLGAEERTWLEAEATYFLERAGVGC